METVIFQQSKARLNLICFLDIKLCFLVVYVEEILFVGKVKESRNRPGVTQTVPGGLGFQISMTFST